MDWSTPVAEYFSSDHLSSPNTTSTKTQSPPSRCRSVSEVQPGFIVHFCSFLSSASSSSLRAGRQSSFTMKTFLCTTTTITTTAFQTFLLFHCLLCLIAVELSCAFAPPSLGLGAVLFPVRGVVIQGISELQQQQQQPQQGRNNNNKRATLQNATDFFVNAFWTAKIGGGAKQLTSNQLSSLRQSQLAEFNKRYGGRSSGSGGREAELLLARNAANEIVACVGVEVERIPTDSLNGPIQARAPLMSNLAVSRQYRRRGLAEKLVEQVEDLVRKKWGYQECFLYVEERNRPAIKLYQKLGYNKLWRDASAKTLMPTQSGSLQTENTVIVCMKKNLRSGLLPWKFF